MRCSIRVWSHVVGSRGSVSILARLQRRALIGLTAAYRTASTEALQVIAGVPPLDLEISRHARILRAKTPPPAERDLVLSLADNDLLDAWQER